MEPRPSLLDRVRAGARRGASKAWGRLARGYRLARLTQRLLRRHPYLITYALVAGAGMLAVFAVLGLPGLWLIRNDHLVIGLVLELAAFTGMAYVRTFVGAALVLAVAEAVRGRRAGMRATLADTGARAASVGGWSLLAGGVQLLLRPFPMGATSGAGWALGRVLGVSWGLLTLMILPVIAFEGGGPVRSLRRSAGLFRERWGEGIVGNAWVTAVTLLLGGVPAVALAGLGVGLLALDRDITGYTLVVLGVALGVLTAAATMTVAQIFAYALYRFATAGEGTEDFRPEVLAGIADRRGGGGRSGGATSAPSGPSSEGASAGRA